MPGVAKRRGLDGRQNIGAGQGCRTGACCKTQRVRFNSWFIFTEDRQLISRGPLSDAVIVSAGKAALGAGYGQRAIALHDQYHLRGGGTREIPEKEKATCCRPYR